MSAPEGGHRHVISWQRVARVAAVMAVGIAVLWLGIRQFGETNIDPPSPTVVSSPTTQATDAPAATPLAVPTHDASPIAPDARDWRPGSLPDLLTRAPDQLSDGSLPLNDIARYSDISAWMAVGGATSNATPGVAEVDLRQGGLAGLALPESLSEFGLDPVWSQTYGFDLTQVDQVLVLGRAPDYVMIFTGSFDSESLQSAWVSSGYQAVEMRDVTVWSLYPEDQIDLSAPASRPAMGTMNNVVLLEDGTLIAAARSSRLAAAINVANGNAPSLAAQEDVAALLAASPELESVASAVLSKGTLVRGSFTTMPQPATPEAAGVAVAIGTPESAAMGEVAVVLTGVRAPGDQSSAMSVWLVLEDEDEAVAAAGVIQHRLANDISPVSDAPYRDRFSLVRAEVEGEVVRLDLTLRTDSDAWQDVLLERDLGFAFWGSGED